MSHPRQIIYRQIIKYDFPVRNFFTFLYFWNIRRRIRCCGVTESSLICYIYPWNLLLLADILQSRGSRPSLTAKFRSYTPRKISGNGPWPSCRKIDLFKIFMLYLEFLLSYLFLNQSNLGKKEDFWLLLFAINVQHCFMVQKYGDLKWGLGKRCWSFDENRC